MQRGRVALAVALSLSLASSVVLAQPGQYPPPQPYPSQPQPYPQQPAPYPSQPAPYPQQPGPYAPPPYAYQPRQPVQLTAEEAELLSKGIITDGQILGGGLAAFFLGFGTGQAIEGRWGDTGWIFTLGEAAGLTLMFVGLKECLDGEDRLDARGDYNNEVCPDGGAGKFWGGLLAYAALHVWEIVDVFTGPSSHNNRVRAIQARMYGYGAYPGYSFYVKPTMNNEGTTAGLTISF